MINVNQSPIVGEINAIPSKSVAHRAMILSALCSTPTKLIGSSTGVDTEATVGMLNSLGANIQIADDGYEIIPIKKRKDNPTVNVHESGSSLRFLLPLVAVLGIKCHIIGEGRLASRPNKELIDALRSGGVSVDNDTLPLNMCGKFNSSNVTIRADISSQFVSGLLMAMQTLPFESQIHLVGELKSKKYVDITIDCMNAFGANVTQTEDGYLLSGGGYKSPKVYNIEGDWSNASFWLVAGAIGGDVTVNNLNLNSRQGDKAIVDILEIAGANISVQKNSVRVKKSNLHAFSYDFEDIPDLVPVCAVLASFACGKSEFTSVERLRLKESDRIASTLDMLNQASIDAYYEKSLFVNGGIHHFGIINGYNDHRIVMSGCIMGAYTSSGVSVTDENAVNKSYINFYKDFQSLGGIINA